MTGIYDTKTFQPRESINFYISRSRKVFIELLERELAPCDVSSSQWAVILILADGRAQTAGELCKYMKYDPGAMTRLLDRLERKGFLRRVRNEDDRRTVQLELTPSGRALQPRIIEALVKVLNHLLRGFSRNEVQQLQGLLQRMLANA